MLNESCSVPKAIESRAPLINVEPIAVTLGCSPRADGARLGAQLRDAGEPPATSGRRHLLLRDELAFVEALLRNPTGTSTDDAVTDLARTFEDGGRWRGSIPLRLARKKIIYRVCWIHSRRPSRHRGTVSLWAATDLDKVQRRCSELIAMLAEVQNLE